MMKILLTIIILLSSIGGFSQSLTLKPTDFYSLRTEKNEWECCFYKSAQGSSGYMDQPALYENKSSSEKETASKCTLDIQITRFEFDPAKNGVVLEGFINGGWNGAGSGVEIFVADPYHKLDTLGRPVNAAIKRKSNEGWPIFTIKTKRLSPSYSFKTADARQENSKSRPFQINFSIKENDIIVFGLRPCIAEVFEIGKIIKQSPTTE